MYDRDQVSGLDVYEYVHVHNSRQGWTHSIRLDFVRQDRDFDQQTTYSPGLKDQLRRPRLLTCEWFRRSCVEGGGLESFRAGNLRELHPGWLMIPIHFLLFEMIHNLSLRKCKQPTSHWDKTKVGSTDNRHGNGYEPIEMRRQWHGEIRTGIYE